MIANAPSDPTGLDRSPWLTMWRAPRATVRRLMSVEVRPSWIPVVALAGVSDALVWLRNSGSFETRGAATALGLALVFRGVLLIYSVLISPFLIAIIGGWLGGEGDADDVRHAVAWGMVPQAFALLAWAPLLMTFGWAAFDPTLVPGTTLEWVAVAFVVLPLIIAPLWAFVLQVAGVATAMRFSVWRALATLLILLLPAFLFALMAAP